MIRHFLFSVLLLPFLALPLAADESGYGGGESEFGTGLNRNTTNEVIRILDAGITRCKRREKKIYRWDCYRLTYRTARRFLSGKHSYSEALAAIQHVETVIAAAVAEHRDPAKPKRRRLTQSFVPIKPEAIPAVRARATQAMEEAQTMLLRAPPHTQSNYVRIAEAINSNKVLLRSALLMLPNHLIRLTQVFINSARL